MSTSVTALPERAPRHAAPVLPDARRLWPSKSPGLTGLLSILLYKIRAREPFRGILLPCAHAADSWALSAYSRGC